MSTFISSDKEWRRLGRFRLESGPGNDQAAVEQVAAIIQDLNLPLEKEAAVKIAVAEAALNGIEHGNQFNSDLPLEVQVWASETAVVVTLIDQGKEPFTDTVEPDLYAKLAGKQSPRGWGMFLITKMVDELQICCDEGHHRVELKFLI